MTQPESRLSRNTMNAFRMEGWFCFKVHGSEHMMAGLPDIVVCAEGHFIGVEMKMPGKRSNTSARQDYVHQLINDAGGYAIVATTVEEAVEAVRRRIKKLGAGGVSK